MFPAYVLSSCIYYQCTKSTTTAKEEEKHVKQKYKKVVGTF